ncbi:MAG: DUF4870 domain-containing protein [Deltaproteobacteria bacterium]|nr:DUF4870 domain-containing protein [Deltaproteobacteria bacterium]
MSAGGNNKGVSGLGLMPHVAGLLCYVFAPVPSIIFLLIEKENKDVLFHAWQATFLGGALIVGSILFKIMGLVMGSIAFFFGSIFSFFFSLLWLAYFILTIVGMIKAYQGDRWKIPVIGDIAAQKAGV